MKYINPGFPQVFQYQTMNDNTIGDDPNHEVSVTGFFTRLSENDMDLILQIDVNKNSSNYLEFFGKKEDK